MKKRICKSLATAALSLSLLATMSITSLAADYTGSEWGPLPESGAITFSEPSGNHHTARPDQSSGSAGSSVSGNIGGDTLQYTAEEFIQAHLDRVNYYRRQHGLGELRLDPQLCEIAQARVTENNGKLSHNRPDGSGFWTIFGEWDTSLKPTAENVSAASANPAHIADGFYASEGHRANMLNEDAIYIGIGLEYVDNEFLTGYSVLQLMAKDA